ncbi:flagellar assembly protein FliH [Halioxenophilus sp. WMMB6]|uniref:flagellar assembly protein FliH n=1 Tax=Halioxenophilus sp. WMMB6 TaxID=3073815 RepID=UPI00295EE9F9|nr:flagellar assembly protein FliH [Halioxenophilus sp. WMMB6]
MSQPKSWETWHLPTLDDGSKFVPSAEKEAKERNNQPSENSEPDAAAEETAEEAIESVELVSEAELHLPSAEELEQIRKSVELEAYSEGFEKGEAHGRDSGHKSAYEETKTEVEQQIEQLQAIVNALQEPLAEQDQAIEKILLDSVVAISQAVIGRELSSNPEQILEVVKQAVAALPYGENATKIYVHSSDLAFLQSYAAEASHWQLVSDDQIQPGGCRVTTADSRVDATVEARLQSALDQFLGKQLAGAGATAEADARENRDGN